MQEVSNESIRCPAHIDGRHIEDWDGSCMGEGCNFRFRPAAPNGDTPEVLLPHAYLLKKLRIVMPLFEEARDALTVITESQRIRAGIRHTLAERMDAAGTYNLADWEKDGSAAAAASPNPKD